MGHLDEDTWGSVIAYPDTRLSSPAAAGAIDAFESRRGVILPASHRAFLQRANGGVVGLARVFGVGRSDALDLDLQITRMQAVIDGAQTGRVLPFANDWGGSYFCYDLGHRPADGDYPVLFWNHEFSEEPEDQPLLWSEFASDFVTFLRGVVS